MIWIGAALYYGMGLTATVVLVVNGHPWFGLLTLLISGMATFKESPTPKPPEE